MMINRITVIGSGIMGLGISEVMAKAGYNVVLRTHNEAKSASKLSENLQRKIKKQILTEADVELITSRITFTSSLEKAVFGADLVIEAIVEEMEAKKRLFQELNVLYEHDAIFASNTSSLSITALAKQTSHGDRIVGLHFFNPPSMMKLVEVIQTDMTSKETLRDVTKFIENVGKTPIVVQDTPGFLVNLMLIPMINAAAFAIQDNLGTPQAIDSAMKLGANHPLGPLALADLIGIDTIVNVMKNLRLRLNDPRYNVCPLLEEMVSKNTLGRKTGKGFFDY